MTRRFRLLAGPNGSGKSTFALDYLPEFAGSIEYVNPDLLAQFAAEGQPVTTDVWDRLEADRRQALADDLAWISRERKGRRGFDRRDVRGKRDGR